MKIRLLTVGIISQSYVEREIEMGVEKKNTQQLFVSCVIPKKGKPYVEILVLGDEEAQERTWVEVYNGNHQIKCCQIDDIWELNWGCVPSSRAGYTKVYLDPCYLGFELSINSVIKVHDSEDPEDIELRSRPITIRMM